MWLKLTQLRTPLEFDEAGLPGLVAETLRLPTEAIRGLQIYRKSLDARHKAVSFVYTVFFRVAGNAYELEAVLRETPNLTAEEPYRPEVMHWEKQAPAAGPGPDGPRPSRADALVPAPTQSKFKAPRPLIVGAGPAGLFAGLRLARAGYRPLIIDRGDGLAERVAAVERFWREGKLDPESNIQFGIGGAGTFSDGKLTSRSKDPASAEVFEILVKMGAPPDIRYWQYPHLGTDLLRRVIEALQRLIGEWGGEFQFRSRLSDLRLQDRRLVAVTLNERTEIGAGLMVLATGNSARDVYHLLCQKGLAVEAKSFAVGLRIEHPQDLINRAQYGRWHGHPRLGAAEYHLTYKHPRSGRGVYSFCMCPGGYVVGATSEAHAVVTNGMSYQARDGGHANAALVVTVGPEDFKAKSPLGGVYFQETLEKLAFSLGGGDYRAPAQRLEDFLRRRPSAGFAAFPPTYRPGVTPANLWDLFPAELSRALCDGLQQFGRQMQGYDWPEAVLTGVETRTSAPVRIMRDADRQAVGMDGIYPAGEGAGYAGGIISSALDGWKTAGAIIEKYQ